MNLLATNGGASIITFVCGGVRSTNTEVVVAMEFRAWSMDLTAICFWPSASIGIPTGMVAVSVPDLLSGKSSTEKGVVFVISIPVTSVETRLVSETLIWSRIVS